MFWRCWENRALRVSHFKGVDDMAAVLQGLVVRGNENRHHHKAQAFFDDPFHTKDGWVNVFERNMFVAKIGADFARIG